MTAGSAADQPTEDPTGFRFSAFGLSEMVSAARQLRTAAARSATFADAARAVVTTLRSDFRASDGQPALGLVRLFTTRQWSDLDAELRSIAAEQLTAEEMGQAQIRCLTLEATTGDEADWNDPTRSRGHRVIALPSAKAVGAAPMIAALVADLGVEVATFASGQPLIGGERFGVFHVPHAAGSPIIPDQGFVAGHRIASVLGFGGVLPGGELFVVIMFSREAIDVHAAQQFRAIAVSVRAGLLAHPFTAATSDSAVAEQRDALDEHVAVLEDVVGSQAVALEQAVARLRAENDLVDVLQTVGRRLTSQLDVDALVQDATDAATRATGARFGAFFYNLIDDYGESYQLYTVSGVAREAFAKFPAPRNTAVFAPTFSGADVIRSDDITADPRYGANLPYHGMPPGHLPVRSYLAVPVVSPTSGDVLGAFFFGHAEPGCFGARHEQLAAGIAGYTAIGLDNARLYQRQRAMATELQRSMIPDIGPVPGFDVVARYLPAATGADVGGDWLDVIELDADRTAFVIGDVMGRGIPAAAIMGQIRTAIRGYALLDLPPAEIMAHVSKLASAMTGNQFTTCVYAVHDPVEGTITYANAAHLPPVVVAADGTLTVLDDRLGLPLRVGDTFQQREVPFPAGSSLVLYTDGLVEQRDRSVPAGMSELTSALARVAGRPTDALAARCDELIAELTGGVHGDDVAFLYIRDRATVRRNASMPLTTDPGIAAAARRFVTATLSGWGAAAATTAAILIATELVANAVRHSQEPLKLRLHHADRRLIIDVVDRDQRLPRRMDAALYDEGHRGLFLVDSYARRWGTRPTGDGKVVWAELDLPTPVGGRP